jgi:MarR family transcriptional regulator, lower aerobic nicotinate degradation pathway regulator
VGEELLLRVLRLTGARTRLWAQLPDPLALIRVIAFEGSDPAELAAAARVLQAATQRLNDHLAEGKRGGDPGRQQER